MLKNQIKAVLSAIPGLPAFAASAIAKQVAAQALVWQELAPIISEIAGNSDLPEMFCGVECMETLAGLMSFSAVYGGQRLYMP